MKGYSAAHEYNFLIMLDPLHGAECMALRRSGFSDTCNADFAHESKPKG